MPAKVLTFWGEEEDRPTGKSTRLTFLDYAEKVLRRARHALTPAEIWAHPEGAAWRGRVHTRGTMQVQTLASALYGDVQLPDSRFVQVGGRPARFGLRREAGKFRRTRAAPGILLALANTAMPEILYISIPAPGEVQQTFRALRGPGTPLPFTCAGAWRVEDRAAAQAVLNEAFGALRFNPRRAFYSLDVASLRRMADMLGAVEETEKIRRMLQKDTAVQESRAITRYLAQHGPDDLLPLLDR